MSSLKTFLINDNGEYKLKQHVQKRYVKKNTLEDKRNHQKMKMDIQKNVNELEEVKKVSNSVPISVSVPVPVPVQVSVPVQVENMQKMEYKKYIPNEKIDRKVKKETDIIMKNSGKNTKEEEVQKHFLSKICKIVGIHGHPHGKAIQFDILNDSQVIKELFELQEDLKNVFPSSKLTALHHNAVDKQKFPGVNIVRQIFKEMGFKLKPVNISEGYLGKKKLLRREYHVIKL